MRAALLLLVPVITHSVIVGFNPVTNGYSENSIAYEALERGDVDEAERLFREEITRARTDEDRAVAHNSLGHVFQFVRRDYDRAEQHFREAARLGTPGNLDAASLAYTNLGTILFDAHKDSEGAKQMWQQAISILPTTSTTSILARNNLATVLKSQHDTDGALRELHIAVAIEPQDAGIHYNLGAVKLDMYDHEGADKHFRDGVALKPTDAKFHYALAINLVALERFAEGKKWLNAGIRLDPSHIHRASVERKIQKMISSVGSGQFAPIWDGRRETVLRNFFLAVGAFFFGGRGNLFRRFLQTCFCRLRVI